jgi:vitamin B12/bleomycin/antimicrobial peptide transport system ATP-binding/permease protein
MFILPQHPYAPLGSLKNLLLYPYHKQNSMPFSFFVVMSVLKNSIVKGILTEPTENQLMQVLKKVNMSLLMEMAGGLSGTVDWPSVLSLGEMQRVSFARLLLAKKQYALLDEGNIFSLR